MATKIYISGGAINVEGVATDIQCINPLHYDWQLDGTIFKVRDKIENQSYELGIYSNVQDKNGIAFTSSALLIAYLNNLIIPEYSNISLAVSRGLIPGHYAINKFGAAPSGIQTTKTDIWDLADATPTQQIWLAPTAARIHSFVSASASDTCGVGTLTLTGQPLDTETVTIGTKVYTFQTVLTDVDGNVLIGATASDSLDNLIAAINLSAGAGTVYAASMTAGSDVVAEAGAGDTMLLFDQQSAGLATTETLTNGSWGAATITPGTGARKIRIYGLKDWDTKESYEDIILHGQVDVSTLDDYVIIYRMKVLTCGTSGPNVGLITATAATDSTKTAAILAGNGQTEMAIFGIPSTQNFYMKSWRCNIDKNVAAVASCDFSIFANEDPENYPKLYLRKHDISVQSTGSNMFESKFDPPLKFIGPCIIKIQAIASAADLDGESSFDGFLIDN